jgi:hypothetical protein
MKTAPSIPGNGFETAGSLPEQLNPCALTERIDAVCAEIDTRLDPFAKEAARRILARTEWAEMNGAQDVRQRSALSSDAAMTPLDSLPKDVHTAISQVEAGQGIPQEEARRIALSRLKA